MATLSLVEFTRNWPISRRELVRYSECYYQPASPIEEFRNDGSRAQRTFLCPWPSRFLLVRDFVGYPEIRTDGTGGLYISRTTPEFHPDFKNSDGLPFLFCTQAQRIEPLGLPEQQANGSYVLRGPSGVNDYFLARVTFLYETLTYDIVEDANLPRDPGLLPDEASWARYITFLPNPSVKGINLPLVGANATAHYVSNYDLPQTDPDVDPANNLVPGQPVKLEKRADLCVTWHDVPRRAIGLKLINPWGTSFPIDDALGKVNSDVFPSAQIATALFQPGTLLLQSCIPRPQRSAHGDRTFNLEFRMSFVDFAGKNVSGQAVRLGHEALLQVKNGQAPPAVYKEVSFEPAAVVAGVSLTPSNLVAKEDGKNIYDWANYAPMFRCPPQNVVLGGP